MRAIKHARHVNQNRITAVGRVCRIVPLHNFLLSITHANPIMNTTVATRPNDRNHQLKSPAIMLFLSGLPLIFLRSTQLLMFQSAGTI